MTGLWSVTVGGRGKLQTVFELQLYEKMWSKLRLIRPYTGKVDYIFYKSINLLIAGNPWVAFFFNSYKVALKSPPIKIK